jgi:hypothetical protein
MRFVILACLLCCGCVTVRPKIAIKAVQGMHGKPEIIVEVIPEISLDNRR